VGYGNRNGNLCRFYGLVFQDRTVEEKTGITTGILYICNLSSLLLNIYILKEGATHERLR
jgi:hypothetical protein